MTGGRRGWWLSLVSVDDRRWAWLVAELRRAGVGSRPVRLGRVGDDAADDLAVVEVLIALVDVVE